MNQRIWIATALALTLTAPAAAWAGGKDIFLDKGCNNCHSISTQGIEGGNPDAPDLAAVGSRQDAEFLSGFLRKKSAKPDGTMHMIKFAGTKEEYVELIDWLMSLK
ncbi:MAG: cytochrome c [Nitrospirota bacterium]|nr:cytochrome c [Nitrospirota bacterium]